MKKNTSTIFAKTTAISAAIFALSLFTSCNQPNSSKQESRNQTLTFTEQNEPKYMVRFNKSNNKYYLSDCGFIKSAVDTKGNDVFGLDSEFKYDRAASKNCEPQPTQEQIEKAQSHMYATMKNHSADKFLKDSNSRSAAGVLAKITTTPLNVKVGDKKEIYLDGGQKKEFTCKAINDKMVAWYDGSLDKNQKTLSDETIQKLIDDFLKFFNMEVDLFGTFDDFTVFDNTKFISTFDDKIHIAISNLTLYDGRKVCGYFSSVDLMTDSYIKEKYPNENDRSNQQRLLYIDVDNIVNDFQDSILTCVHEFQHLLGFIHDCCIQNKNWEMWYTEMLSVFSEDLFHNMIAALDPTKTLTGPYDRLNLFSANTNFGVTYWNIDNAKNNLIGYAVNYAFGAFMFRNYPGQNGKVLLKEMTSITNNCAGVDAINYALEQCGYKNEDNSQKTFDDLVAEFYKTIIDDDKIAYNYDTMKKLEQEALDQNKTVPNSFLYGIDLTAKDGNVEKQIKANSIVLSDYKYEQIVSSPTGLEMIYPNGFTITKLPQGIREITYEVPYNENDIEIIFY